MIIGMNSLMMKPMLYIRIGHHWIHIGTYSFRYSGVETRLGTFLEGLALTNDPKPLFDSLWLWIEHSRDNLLMM